MRASPLGQRLFPRPAVVAAAGFTPASVSGLDFWIEADATKLYTDNGVTLVSADGDAVYLAKDKSSAARDASNSTVGQRPLYKTDLSKPSLKFDGTDDLLTTAGGLSWGDGSGQMWFAMSVQSDTTNQREIMTLKNGSTYIADIYVNTTAHMEMNGTSGFEEDATAAATLAANTPAVIIGTITTTQLEAFVDNVSNGAHTNAGTPSTSTGNMILCSSGSAWAGRVFCLCHGTGTLSSGDRASLQTYLAALHP